MLTKSTVKARPTVLWCYKNKDDAISKYIFAMSQLKNEILIKVSILAAMARNVPRRSQLERLT